MHFALPPRRTSHPPPYAVRKNRNRFSFNLRQRQIQLAAIVGLGIIGTLLLISSVFGRGKSKPSLFKSFAPPGTPGAVIVTVLDNETYPSSYLEQIKENREDYARRHGYATFFPHIKDYPLNQAPDSWALIPALRHAANKFQYTPWVFFLTQNSLIMNPSLSLEKVVTKPEKLESLMLKNAPVVPPESVIRTFNHLKAPQVDLIISQDGTSLAHRAFLLRNWGSVDSSGRREDGEWAKFFLDTWFDPLYRSYNFQKAQGHALEHIVQWHPTILAKLALVPQRTFNSYAMKTEEAGDDSLYKEGDFVIQLNGCEGQGAEKCAKDLEPFYGIWQEKKKKGS